jgi:FlaA1/EpsC-like NDP-sugar epimerase
MPWRLKQLTSIVADWALLSVAFWSALALRFETFTLEVGPYFWQMIAVPLLAIPIFIKLGLYRAVIRFMEDRVVFVVAGGVVIPPEISGG